MGRRLVYIRPQSGYLPLTTAWITTTGETDTTILNALNSFESGLISNSLISKISALYPFIGSTALKHTYNFMNTAQYQLTFNGGWTHSSNGVLPNGTNAFADTNYNLNLLSLNDAHISYYSRTNNTTNAIDMGANGSGGPNFTYITLRSVATGVCVVNAASTSFLAEVGYTDTLGLGIATRTTSTNTKLFRRLVKTETNSLNSVNNFPSRSIYIGARNNNGVAAGFSNRECAFASIGLGFSDSEANTFYNLVQQLQIDLSRQV